MLKPLPENAPISANQIRSIDRDRFRDADVKNDQAVLPFEPPADWPLAAEQKQEVWAAGLRRLTQAYAGLRRLTQAYLGNSVRTLPLGRAMTWAAISLPSEPTLALPASTAAFTAATSPLMITVM